MKSPYGNPPEEEELFEAQGELEESFHEAFDYSIELELNPNDRNTDEQILYIDPAVSEGTEKEFIEEKLAELLEAETVNMIYTASPIGSEAKGYEIWIQ
ncbi:MAG: hypothetical protein ABEJ72_03865 [Candidatus Aenigmatarchaeota archaeon]